MTTPLELATADLATTTDVVSLDEAAREPETAGIGAPAPAAFAPLEMLDVAASDEACCGDGCCG